MFEYGEKCDHHEQGGSGSCRSLIMSMGVLQYGEKCIFFGDNMSKECQDVQDDVEVKP